MRLSLGWTELLKQLTVAGIMLALLGQTVLLPAEKGDASIQGKLIAENGKPSVLETAGKGVRLYSGDASISATLHDTRLSGREFKFSGKWKSDGSFEVRDYFVLHGDQLFRLIYFCDTCNITTFSPGICLCCQQPTVPMEVPLTDHRVYHEEIKPRPPE